MVASQAKWICFRRILRVLLPIARRVVRQRRDGAGLVEEDYRVKLALQPTLRIMRVALCLRGILQQNRLYQNKAGAVPVYIGSYWPNVAALRLQKTCRSSGASQNLSELVVQLLANSAAW